MNTPFPKILQLNLLSVVAALATGMGLICSSLSMASVYGPAPYFDNLLINPNGDVGDLSGWVVTSNGGNGWAVDLGPHRNETADNGFLTSYGWARREQTVDLLAQGFTSDFLDAQPTIIISEAFEKIFCPDKFFVAVDLLDINKNLIRTWSSGELQHRNTTCDYSGYKEQVSTEITHYGAGVRYLRWRDGGKDSEYWLGYFGSKLQNAYLALAPANLLKNQNELSSWTVLQDGGDGFEVVGPPEARQFRTSFDWGRRQQTIDLLATGFTTSELDSGQLAILARGTYGEVACPDEYYLKIELLDQNHAILVTRDSGIRIHDGECDWTYSGYNETVYHRIVDYPPGVRYIRWEDGGKDREMWAGHYGAALQAPYLGIINYHTGLRGDNGRILAALDYLPAIVGTLSYGAAGAACIYSFFTLCAPALELATVVTAGTQVYVGYSSVSVVPVPPQPTDAQSTPTCDAECKLDKIKSGLYPGVYSKLWNVDRNAAVQIFSGPKEGGTNLLEPGQEILQAVAQTISTGTKLIDITTLADIRGDWVDAIGNALRTIESNAATNHNAPVVRIYLGLPGVFTGWPSWLVDAMARRQSYLALPDLGIAEINWDNHLQGVLSRLTSSLQGNSDLTIFISGGRSFADQNWNHSKIVAVDGREAIVGGHNLWPEYFDQAPVFDTSVKVNGDSAVSAHRFVDELWADQLRKFPQPNTHALSWNKKAILRAINPPTSSLLGNISNSPEGPIQVLGVGQTGSRDYPSPLRKAVLNMVDAATRSIYISQQSLVHPYVDSLPPILADTVDRTLAASLAKKAIEGVSIEAILSNVDAPHDTKSNVDNERLLGIVWTAAVINGVQDSKENQEKFCENFKVSNLRIDDVSETYFGSFSDTFPGSTNAFANHSKTIMIDKQVFLIGSHNLYAQDPAQLSEYAYVVADSARAEGFYDSYWEPVLRFSARTKLTAFECLGLIDIDF